MFSINNFIMNTLKGMIGNYPDFQITEYALNWYGKGKLTEDDLSTIQNSINEYNTISESVKVINEESLENIEVIDETTSDITEPETESETIIDNEIDNEIETEIETESESGNEVELENTTNIETETDTVTETDETVSEN